MTSTKLHTLRVDLVSDNQAYERAMARSMATNQRFASSARKNVVTSNHSVSSSFRNAAASVAVLDGPLGGIAGRMSSFGSVVGSTGVALGTFGVAMAGTTVLLYKGVQAFSDLEQRQLKTQALIKATGQSAGLTASQLDTMARSLALNTLASTQQIREAQDVLLTFRSVSGPIFKETIVLSQDLAAVMGTDAKQAALQLAKALEEPTIGLNALRRSGVSFSESEKELIKDLAETNRLAEAQALILEKVRQQVGGAGAGEAGGLAGSADTLSQRWEEFLEAMGKTSGVVTPASSSLNFLSETLEKITQRIDPSDQIRLNDLLRERQALQDKLAARDKQFGGATLWDALTGQNLSKGQIKKNIEDINQQILTIQNAQIEKIKKEGEAQEAAQKAEQDRIQQNEAQKAKTLEEKQKKELAARQLQSSAILVNLETQLASEQERLAISHRRRREQIEQLVLSEQQIRQAGYDNLNQLQESFLAANDQNYQAALQKRQERERAAAEAERKRKEEELKPQKGEAEGWLENLRQQSMTKLELLNAQEQAEYDLAEDYRQRNLLNDAQYMEAKIEIERKYDDERKRLEKLRLSTMLKNNSLLFGGLADLSKTFAGEQSSLYKAMFATSKAFAIANSIMAIQTGMAEAWKLGWPLGIPAAAAVAAETASIVSTIQGTQMQGMAHDGMDYIPKEGTWLLDKGERVVDSRTNADLKSYLDQNNKSGMASGSPDVNWSIIVNEAPPGTTASIDERAQIIEIAVGQAVATVEENISRGGNSTANTFEQSYGLNRAWGI